MNGDAKFTYLALAGFFLVVGLLYGVYVVFLTPILVNRLGMTVTEIGGTWELNTLYELVFVLFALPFVLVYFWGWVRWNPWAGTE